MTTIYKIRSSAVRAAKREFGEDYSKVATIADIGSGFIIEVEKVVAVDPVAITKEVEVIEQLNEIDKNAKAKNAKKKEIESRKPAFIPQAPIVEAVIEIPAPTPIPSLPAFLIPSPPSESEVPEFDLAAAQNAADKNADIVAVNVNPLKPRLSSIERPTKKVWDIADKMPGAKRKEVIEACVLAGIAYGTARTQYQHWFKTMADSAATPIATIGKDGKIVPPTK